MSHLTLRGIVLCRVMSKNIQGLPFEKIKKFYICILTSQVHSDCSAKLLQEILATRGNICLEHDGAHAHSFRIVEKLLYFFLYFQLGQKLIIVLGINNLISYLQLYYLWTTLSRD